MKRILYISALLIGLIFVSCRKEEIKPTDRSVCPDTAGSIGKARSGTSDTGAGTGTNTGDGGITDPNDDEEIHNSKGK